ncbi:MAG: hypothetical protein WCT37_00415 [Patescibacteria group bacterium]|jgi:hypothetical protein
MNELQISTLKLLGWGIGGLIALRLFGGIFLDILEIILDLLASYWQKVKPLPRLPYQVTWPGYLANLTNKDAAHVREICRRLADLSRKHNLPIAVMAVGSALNRDTDRLGQKIPPRDIDLLLLAANAKDADRANQIFRDFIARQPEVDRDKTSGEPKEHTWNVFSFDNCSKFWELNFPGKSRTVQLFVHHYHKVGHLRQQLRQEIKKRLIDPDYRFAYLIIAESASGRFFS